MTWAIRIVAGLCLLLASVAVNIGVLGYLGKLNPVQDPLIIDAKTVVRIFTEERGEALSEEDFKRAIREFDRIVMAEAELLYLKTGRPIINATHMLAGGIDVSDDFARHVIARWDDIQ